MEYVITCGVLIWVSRATDTPKQRTVENREHTKMVCFSITVAADVKLLIRDAYQQWSPQLLCVYMTSRRDCMTGEGVLVTLSCQSR